MSRERLAIMMEQQALACARMKSPLYSALLLRVADDIRAGGPCATAVAGAENNPSTDAIALRLMGAVHALVLSARAPALATAYPSVGGSVDPARPDACWPAFREAVAANPGWIQEWMAKPPQTNEVGRANLLIVGLLAAIAHCPLPVRLFELGCSAGLNLLADRFRYVADDFAWGPAGSPVVLRNSWQDPPPTWLVATARDHPFVPIIERHGCDLLPVDPTSPNGILVLRAYVWADQTDRFERLDAALKVAAKLPVEVEATGAADFVQKIRLEPGTLTIVWHSVVHQFVSTADWTTIETQLARLAAASSGNAGFAGIGFEPGEAGWHHDFQLKVQLGTAPAETLAEADAHGLPAKRPVRLPVGAGQLLRYRPGTARDQ